MKAVILARVSTTRQEEEGHSLPAQIRRLEDYAKRKDFEVVKTFSFSESAGDKIRKKFLEVINYIKNNKDVRVLLCENVDRATRNFKDAVDLDEMRKNEGLEIHFVQDGFFINKNASGNQMFMWEAKVFIAKQYLNRLSDDVKRSNELKIQNGEWINKPPIGYIGTIDEKGNKGMIPDPLKSHLVVKMFQMYATGSSSTQKIKETMEAMGLRSNTKDKKPLCKSQIHHILNNPYYYGEMRINGQLYEHKYEPLITKQLFDRVQEVFKGYDKKPFRYGCKPFVFRALVRCAECGCLITGEIKKGQYVYYSCSNYKKVHKHRVYVKEGDLLLPVYKVLKKIKLTNQQKYELIEDFKKSDKSKNKFVEATLAKLTAEFSLYENRKSETWNKYVDKEISKEMYNKKLQEYDSKQADIASKMSKFQVADKEFYTTIDILIRLTQRAEKLFESSEPHEKRAFANFLLQNCQLEGKNLKFELKSPFDGALKANECSNLLRIVWDVRTIIQQHKGYVYIPDLRSFADSATTSASN
jgi:DNA invertase Pin-like site-specific DNA recombinase